MAASNTKDCFRECVGKRIKGVLFDALPDGRPDLSDDTKTLVFEDGTGLTISGHGTFWLENAAAIALAIDREKRKLAESHRAIQDVLTAAGEAI